MPAVALLEAAGCAVHYMPPFPSAAAVASRVGEVQADAVLSRQGPVGAGAMDASPRLRIVARHGVGVDDVDLAAAAERGIVVTRAPGSNTRAVAEHALAMMLALAKELHPSTARVASGLWREAGMQVRDIAGLRLGLVGYGAVGRRVARLALAFGMRVTAFSPGLRVDDGAVAAASDLPALLACADVLSLHCPLTAATRHLIGAAALAALPRAALVINTARGGLIDEVALHAALGSGQVAGAGLDVFEDEPPRRGSPLLGHPRVITTPHVSGATPGALVAMGVMAAECIVAALAGRPVPPDRVVRG